MKKIRARCLLGLVVVGCCSSAIAAPQTSGATVSMHLVDAQGVGLSIGTIHLEDSKRGLLLVPKLKGLTPGGHGFHIHENPDCSPKEKEGQMIAALAAGGHLDPHATGKHLGPHGGGHDGDLPKLEVAEDGSATTVMRVEGISLADVSNRSIMIHAGGDNYSDTPALLGGGGARVACGVIPK